MGEREVGPKAGAVFEVCVSASHLGVLWPSRTGEQGLGIGSQGASVRSQTLSFHPRPRSAP